MKRIKLALALLCSSTLFAQAQAQAQTQSVRSVRDDSGAEVKLGKPAQRVISLAPHTTELVFAAGGGKRLVGVVSYSDFPPEAKQIQNVGDNRQWDMERIIALKPDLLVVWHHGNGERQIESLKTLGVPIFMSEPKQLEGIADNVQKLGWLMGTESQAQANAQSYRQTLQQLRSRYAKRAPVRVFYQVWDKPLYTLNGQHIVTDALRLCGGENVFASLPILAPNVGVEAVLKENPEVILSGNRDAQAAGGVNFWKAYPGMLAVKQNNLFSLDGDLLGRAGPRMVQGTALICEKLDMARQRRTAAAAAAQ